MQILGIKSMILLQEGIDFFKSDLTETPSGTFLNTTFKHNFMFEYGFKGVTTQYPMYLSPKDGKYYIQIEFENDRYMSL